MGWACRTSAVVLSALLLAGGGGCNTTVSSFEFIAKYTNNIDVPDPQAGRWPTRTFLGRRGRRPQYFVLQDRIPPEQGGGLFGRTVNWRCPVSELPESFPEHYCPGDAVLDGREGSPQQLMIHARRGRSSPPPAAPARPERP